ncbi:hypothetical protein NHP21005_09650 [Helicobacter sp. NHP21005]|uniref:hypothetical protein n=1 Tax=Helicobacter felistomachi TaxID=3040201 RepID=UPI002572BB5E|nr:hypothetical protein [Helicobacter sp. NHP21005]BEG57277.1 hypothetical protein NHP21005_09650 [Helicobacter sp. NHP21005]
MAIDYNACSERRLFRYLNTTEQQISKTQAEYQEIAHKFQNKLQSLQDKKSKIRVALGIKSHIPNRETQIAMQNVLNPDETYMETISFAEFAERAEKED